MRIFIVDDHPITCEGLAEWLPMQDESIEVIGYALDGWEALENIGTLLPDVVILDYKLSGLNGDAVAEEIRQQG